MASALRVVALISGRGSNLAALIRTAKALHSGQGVLSAAGVATTTTSPAAHRGFDVCAVVSSHPDAAGLAIARDAQIATEALDHTRYPDRLSFEHALIARIDAHEPELLVLAGFMRVLDASTVRHFGARMINIHPSLLPKYRGLHTHRQALEAGDQAHGASVHRVTADLDGGPVLAQCQMPIHAYDTAADLAARLLPLEHQLLPVVTALCADFPALIQEPRPSIAGQALLAPLQWSSHEGLTAPNYPDIDAVLVASGFRQTTSHV